MLCKKTKIELLPPQKGGGKKKKSNSAKREVSNAKTEEAENAFAAL